jgi:hypothetical protein
LAVDACSRTSQGTNRELNRSWAKGIVPMMIFMLAVAMTIAMLIATAFGIHQEAQRVRLRSRDDRFDPFIRMLR